MKRSKQQYKRMAHTFDRFTVGECKRAYDLNRIDGLLIRDVAVTIGQTIIDTELMIDAYASHLTLDSIPVGKVVENAELQKAIEIKD